MKNQSTFILQSTVAAGPRKERGAGLELGEDVACTGQSDSRYAFCLCDGTSGEQSFCGLSTRRLAQDFASLYVCAALSRTDLGNPALAAAKALKDQWDSRLIERWLREDNLARDHLRSRLPPMHDGMRALHLSFVFIGGSYDAASKELVLVNTGDCTGWIFFTRTPPQYVPAKTERIVMWLELPDESQPTIKLSPRLATLQQLSFQDVDGWIFLTDGVENSERLRPVIERDYQRLPDLIEKFRSLRADTGDDRGLVTACHHDSSSDHHQTPPRVN